MPSALVSILLLLIAPSFVHATLSDLSRELIGEGLISIDENGIPVTECMVLKNGTSTPQACKMTEGFGARSVGCFTLWTRAGFVQQGCYSGQELSLRDQCRKGKCTIGRGPVFFCCCHGALCNAELIV